MISHIFQRGAEPRSFTFDQPPARPATHRHLKAWFRQAAEMPERLTDEVRVLRVLIEEFGGEAYGTALDRFLAQRAAVTGDALSGSTRTILSGLALQGALFLESIADAEIVARILPQGAALAYDPALRR